MSDTKTVEGTDNAEDAGGWDPAAANAWEETLIADLRANGGRASGGPLAGQKLVVVYTKGAKSGERRRAILTPSEEGDDLLVAGTASGAPTTPSWVHNIRANPEVEVMLGDETFPATAKIEEGAERDRLWDQHVAQLPRFAEYPSQTGGRIIPMIRLTRRSA